MSWGEWRRLVEMYLRPHRRLVAVLAASLFTNIGLQIATPQLVRVFVDRATSPGEHALEWIASVYVVAVLLQQALQVLSTWLSEQVGWYATNELRCDLMAHCLDLDPSFHETHPPGAMIERVDGDLNGLSQFFSQFLLTVVGNLLLLLGVLVVVSVQHGVPGLVFALAALVSLGILVLVRRVAAPAWQRSRDTSASLFGFIEERLAGAQDLRSAGAEAHTLAGFYGLARDRIRKVTRARQMDAIPWLASGTIRMGFTAVSFLLPTALVQRGSITVGEAFVIYFYAQLLLTPLNEMSHQVETLQQAIAGGRRVIELLGTTTTIVDGPNAALPRGALTVELDGVTFGYGEGPAVLHDVSISVPAGGVLGLVGRTGSGKSSIARLLVRFHDVDEGAVRVGGVDVRDLRRIHLRERVTLVTQEVHLLRASVRDNLTLFDPSIPDAEVLRVIETLGLDAWFAALPDGLGTELREGGAGMSAGEAQLLSFGRALLADPSVVVLDEASSRLDPATENLLERAVDALLRGRTGIVIAHRLATLGRCDAVCVLDHGRVVEYGRRADLAADATSRFAALLRAGLDTAVPR
ncbi:MAG TPA: ABC transporter ATP-binding protein [Acidimicrobiales bacterium]|nr:ABC transporter ATP-binding protein [Acidimicrobiales bacterium]